jgi:hypothetical protein
VLSIDVYESRELQAVLLSIRRADRELRKQIRQQTQRLLLPEWKKSLAEHANTRLEHRVLVDTGRIKMSDQNVRMSSATVGRKLSGGLDPKTQAFAVEFGGDRSKKRTYEVSRGGKTWKVTRRTAAQLRPRRRNGYVVYPAAKQMIPRFARLWVQTTVRTMHEAFEGRL